MTRTAHVGAFSMSNYGDQIYPSVIDALAREVGSTRPVRHFGLIPGELPDGRPVAPIADFASAEVDAALIGGGDIIRVDRAVVALDHLCVPTERRATWSSRVRARRFARGAIGDRPGPWLARDWGVPAAYVSAGVHTLPGSSEMAEALGSLAGAWVRTTKGADILRNAGMRAATVLTAPDAVFALGLVESAEDAAARGRRMLEESTGHADGVAVFHAAGFAGWDSARMSALLSSCAGVPRAVVALGAYAGEHVMLEQAATRAGVPFLGIPRANDVSALFAAAGCVVSTSMHAAIVAATYGRPVISPGVAKTAAAFEACVEPPPLHQARDAQIPALVSELVRRDRDVPGDANQTVVLEAFARITSLLEAS